MSDDGCRVFEGRGLSKHYGPVVALDNVDFSIYPVRSSPSSVTTAPGSRLSSRSSPEPYSRMRGRCTTRARGSRSAIRMPPANEASKPSTRILRLCLRAIRRRTCSSAANSSMAACFGHSASSSDARWRSSPSSVSPSSGSRSLLLRGYRSSASRVGSGRPSRSPAPAPGRPRCSSWTSRRLRSAFNRPPPFSISSARSPAQGVGVVLITHIMPHVVDVADRLVVLRHGSKVADIPSEGVTTETLVRLIVGFDPEDDPQLARDDQRNEATSGLGASS